MNVILHKNGWWKCPRCGEKNWRHSYEGGNAGCVRCPFEGILVKEEESICTFPDCGCPEARLCMAGNPNPMAETLNRPKRGK